MSTILNDPKLDEFILNSPKKIKRAKILIYTLSIVIPVAVALIFEIKLEGFDFSILPPVYAILNGLTAIVLILALIAIKRRAILVHRALIRTALLFSIWFLILYVAYHITSTHTEYEGSYPKFYYSLLISHIILSVAVVPLVLFSYLQAWQGKFERHKKWVRFSYPVWLYVAISGVIVYLMISPFYK